MPTQSTRKPRRGSSHHNRELGEGGSSNSMGKTRPGVRRVKTSGSMDRRRLKRANSGAGQHGHGSGHQPKQLMEDKSSASDEGVLKREMSWTRNKSPRRAVSEKTMSTSVPGRSLPSTGQTGCRSVHPHWD